MDLEFLSSIGVVV